MYNILHMNDLRKRDILDLQSDIEKTIKSLSLDQKKQKLVERQVSDYIQSHFRFIVFPVPQKEDRLILESRIISTVSLCPSCRPSPNWLGLFSPKEKIRESGLWIVNELYKQPLTQLEFENLKRMIFPNT